MFKFKKIAGRTDNDNIKGDKLMVSLKCLSNFWRTLEMSLINFEINLILIWSQNCFIIDARIANQILISVYVPLATL